MRKEIIFALALFASAIPGTCWAQSTILQGGSWEPGHVPMYVGDGSSQPVVQDSGPAGGGGIGLGISEFLMTMRGPGAPPYSATGSGPLGTNYCDYDAPNTNATGYHYLCWSPNAGSGTGIFTFGAAGGASEIPLIFNINGINYNFEEAVFANVPNDFTVPQTFSVSPIFSSLTGYVYANGSGALTAALTIPNSGLANPSTTVNGVPCTLGSGCTVTATAANALTFGTHLTGTSYNGSSAVTIGTDATSANTASTIMARDGSGNVSVNTLTGAVTGHSSLDLAVSSLGANVASALAINIGIAGSVATQSTISGTTSLGIGALQFNTTGINNTALGFNALFNNTTGSDNVAIGQHALYTSTTGSDSVAIGRNAGANMTGSTNVAIGSNTLSSATSSDIVAVGVDALQNLTSGTANTAVGEQALQNDTTGGSNTAFGDGTGEKITTGQSNTLFGSEAGNLIITGSYNVGVGSNALQAENAGENIAIGNFAGSAVTGQGQIFIGYQAGVAATATDTSASPNIGIGVQALEAVTSGQDNIAIGSSTLAKIMTSNNSLAIGNRALGNMVDGGAFGGANMGIGVDAGGSITTGSENTIVGRGAYEPLTTGVQNVGLGVQAGQADVTSNYTVAIGTSSLGGLLSGDRNTGLGQGAGFETEGVNDAFAVTTGDHDTFLGASTTLHSASQYSHVTVIGANAAAAVDANNTITLGRSADSLYVPNLTTAGLATVGASGLIGSETLATVPQGGTGLATLTSGAIYKGNGTGALVASALSDNGTAVTSGEPLSLPGGTLSAPGLALGTAGFYSTGTNFGMAAGGADIIDYAVSNAAEVTINKTTVITNALAVSSNITTSNSGAGFRAASTAGFFEIGSDTVLCRSGTGIWEAGTSTSSCNSSGTLRAQVVGTPTGYTVATLPTAVAGDRAYVTDATTCTFGSTPTGSGSAFCPVIYSGAAWVGG